MKSLSASYLTASLWFNIFTFCTEQPAKTTRRAEPSESTLGLQEPAAVSPPTRALDTRLPQGANSRTGAGRRLRPWAPVPGGGCRGRRPLPPTGPRLGRAACSLPTRAKQAKQTPLGTGLGFPTPAGTRFRSPPPVSRRSQSGHAGGRDVRRDQVADVGQGTYAGGHVQEPVREGAERLGGRKGGDTGKAPRVRVRPEARAGRRGGHLRVPQIVVETDAADGRIGLEVGSLVPEKETSGHGGSSDAGGSEVLQLCGAWRGGMGAEWAGPRRERRAGPGR